MARGARVIVVASALGLVACGRDFDPASDVKSLRVLAVQLSSPIAKPGQVEHLEMLAYDASPHATRADGTRRPLSITWFGGCDDPPGDLYYKCYPIVAAELAGDATAGPVGHGASFDVTIPADVITSRKGSHASVPYGLSYVVYAVCGGALVSRASDLPATPPMACVDERGADLGPDDFVIGYEPIYAYDTLTTKNPIVTGGEIDHRSDAVACATDAECAKGDHCGSGGVCLETIAHCEERAARDCPSFEVRPFVDPATAEPDQVAFAIDGAVQSENVRVFYYATAGTFSSDQRKVSDPAFGYQDDYDTTWTPPLEPAGEVHVWAVVRDNRGGTSWFSRDVWVP